MTKEELRAALQALDWKQVDLARRLDLSKATVWGWINRADKAVPRWVAEYLRAMQAIQRLHVDFVLGLGEASPAPEAMPDAPAPETAKSRKKGKP